MTCTSRAVYSDLTYSTRSASSSADSSPWPVTCCGAVQVSQDLFNTLSPAVMQQPHFAIDAAQRRCVVTAVDILGRAQPHVVDLAVGKFGSPVAVGAARLRTLENKLAPLSGRGQRAVRLAKRTQRRLQFVKIGHHGLPSSREGSGPSMVSVSDLHTDASRSVCQPCQVQGAVRVTLCKAGTVLNVP